MSPPTFSAESDAREIVDDLQQAHHIVHRYLQVHDWDGGPLPDQLVAAVFAELSERRRRQVPDARGAHHGPHADHDRDADRVE